MITAAAVLPAALPLRLMGGHLQADGYPLHRHDFLELVIILGGSGVHLVDRQRYPVAAGDVFVVQGEQVHGFPESDDLTLMNLMFQPERLGLPLAHLHALPGYHALFMLEPRWRRRHGFRSRLRLPPHGRDEVAGMIERLQRELEACRPGYEALSLAILLELLVYLSRQYTSVDEEAPRRLLRIGRVISALETRYADAWTLAELAELAHLSVNSLLLHFRQATGASPIDYLIRRRVAHAATLLRETDATITAIAHQVGFSDGNYFSRQFTRVMGTGPRAWRRQQAGKIK